MPRLTPPSSLVDLCVESVLANMDEVWCSDKQREHLKAANYKFVVGPFDDLPTDLARKILSVLKSRNRLRKHHLQLLITPYLRHLDLSACPEAAYGLQLASARCGSMLKVLDLSNCPKISDQVFRQSFPAFENLTVLRVAQNNKFDDRHLSVVSVYGSSLEELDLSGTGVTDNAVGTLVSSEEAGDDRYGNCRNLKTLKLTHTEVSVRAVAKILLKMDKLTVLEYEDSVGAVYAALQRYPSKKFRLLSLTTTRGSDKWEWESGDPEVDDGVVPYDHATFPAAVRACPSVRRVSVVAFMAMTPDFFHPLCDGAYKLSEIVVRNDDEMGSIPVMTPPFTDFVAPLLLVQGDTLTKVDLCAVRKVCVGVLLDLCPNLKSLALRQSSAFLSRETPASAVKENALQAVTLVADDRHEKAYPTEEDLLEIMKAPLLQELFITSCPTFTDDLLARAVEQCEFSRLEYLGVHACHQITMEGLEPLLMDRKNPLKFIDLHECKDIYLRDVERYRRFLKKGKLDGDVFVEYS